MAFCTPLRLIFLMNSRNFEKSEFGNGILISHNQLQRIKSFKKVNFMDG